MHWYYEAGGTPSGPLDVEAFTALIARGTIKRDTLVWSTGMAGWEAAQQRTEFAGQFEALPPPMPSARLAETFAPPLSDAPAGFAPSPTLSAALQPRLAGPWTRFLARFFDQMVLTALLSTGIGYGLAYVDFRLAFALMQINGWLLNLAAFVALMPTNAILLRLFGNTPGKALFGIRAKPLGENYFTLREAIAREFRVWLYGTGASIPIVWLIAASRQYSRVARGKPAGYDAGRAEVIATSSSKIRWALAFVLSLAACFTVVGLQTFGSVSQEALLKPSSWTNPKTGTVTTIPAGWEIMPPEPSTPKRSSFVNVNTGMAVIMGWEDAADGIDDISEYTRGLATALAPTTVLEPWFKSPSNPDIWVARGTTNHGNAAATYYATQIGSRFWRVIYIDQIDRTPRQITDEAMSTALFASIGVTP